MIARSLIGVALVCAAPLRAQDAPVATEEGITLPRPLDPQVWAAQIQADYPSFALRNGEEGTVKMRLEVDPDGRVTDCRVTDSSGSAMLDQAACSGMTRYARYTPARDEQGNATRGAILQTIRYVLPDGPTPPAGGPPPTFLQVTAREATEWRPLVFDTEFMAALRIAPFQLVAFGVTTDPDGGVTGCGVIRPSGDAELDIRTCASLVRHGRFEVLRMPGGAAIPGMAIVTYPAPINISAEPPPMR